MLQAIVFAVVLCAGAVAPAWAQDANALGEKVFVDQKCTLCHSVAGRGNVKGPLDDVGSRLSPAEIRAWITDPKDMTAKTSATRKPEMKAYILPKVELDLVVAYLSAMKKQSVNAR